MKEKEYIPTSFFFDSKKWSEVFDLKERNTSSLFNDGLIIGELLREIDQKCARLVKVINGVSEHEIMVYQQNLILNLFLDSENGRFTENLDSLLETIHESSQLCIKISDQKVVRYKQKDIYHELYSLASKRIYLQNQWEKITKSNWTFKNNEDGIILSPSDCDVDFGEKIAVQRFKDHLLQLLHGAYRDGGFVDPKIKFMPSDILITNDRFNIIYDEPDEDTSIQHQLILNQHPFYYRGYENIPLNDFQHLTLFDVRYFWIVFIRLSTCIIKCFLKKGRFNQPVIFSKDELVNILTYCINISKLKAEQLVELHTNSKRKLSDFYLKPIYEIDGSYYISLGVFMGGQITRVIDEVVKTQLNIKELKKGKFFEKFFAKLIADQIYNNKILQTGFCRVLALGFKQSKGKENEEIDIIIRIGETYLLIEAKSFIYRTGVMGYHNNLNEMKGSNAKQKINFFLSEYDRFREIHDKNAIFDLKPENVIFCYLSSVPHAAGIKINNMPVVDSSILERYFCQGNFEMRNKDGELKTFDFYTSFDEAERNLKRYLNNPPQLERLRSSFSYVKSNQMMNLNGMNVSFQEALFNLNEENELQTVSSLWLLADSWHNVLAE
ncbi:MULTISPECIES: hypothetical protein [unclassified Symbiopectobacterium]|uniref:hypothetical protein n=1 Tax=unclassified Symbiopectobacterium TaxID=2794573 RepID=UPI00222744CA|nr:MULTISPECIES: hypothetical protein [unclassified Symbiopectobacterium]MCW2476444.1 hypothetical protein [Candidatus Symbiopectobacterium sp. NZEC151]MCW2481922.1 hypothetical protein [Candidatus Symbiopectobacterium sp. NZEC135]